MSYPSQLAYQPRQQYWIENVLGGGVKVHVPDLVGQAHATGQTRALDQRMGITQPNQEIIRMPDGSIRLSEGPPVTGSDSLIRPEMRQVPYAPGMPMIGQQPHPGWDQNPGVASPGFSSVPPAQGYGMSTTSIPNDAWQSTPPAVKTWILHNIGYSQREDSANPNPIKDAKDEEEEEEEHRHRKAVIQIHKNQGVSENRGTPPDEEEEEEEEEIRRHNTIMQNIKTRYAQELGPVASDGNQVSAVGSTHKHLPSAGKPAHGRAVGVDNQPHAFAGGQMKKIAGETNVSVSGPGDGKAKRDQMGDEEEEEERFKAHAGVTCEKAHGMLPHKAWSAQFHREGTSTMGNMIRGDPLNLPTPADTSARQAAKRVGTTSSEAKSPEEEEEEEEERHRIANYQIKMRRLSAQNSYEGTAQRPGQGIQNDPLNMNIPSNMNPTDTAAGKGAPANIAGENLPNPSVIQQQGQRFHLERNVRDLGSGVPAVTINSLPVEYTQRMQFMVNNMREIYGPPPSQRGQAYGESAPAPNRNVYMQQDPNRYPTVSVSGMPANAQTAIVRSAGTINDIVQSAWQAAGPYAGNNQERVRMAWQDTYNRYMQQLGASNPQIRQTLMSQPRSW